MGQSITQIKFSMVIKTGRWGDSTEEEYQPAGESENSSSPQRAVQSPEPGLEELHAAVQARKWLSNWQLCQKDLEALINKDLDMN